MDVFVSQCDDLSYIQALIRRERTAGAASGLPPAAGPTYKRAHTEAFCVSPSATDLPFVYSALPGYSL